ncbi:MAG: succinate--CoA ligase subunit alpha [Chloroflexota bacterium]
MINNPTRRVLVQGITGSEGSYWTEKMLEYGTHVVAGVTPRKGGQMVHGLPVYDTVGEACANHEIDLSVIFVPARFTKGAAFEAIEAGVPDLIVLTEFIPIHDVMAFMAAAQERGTRIIGPNCPGVVFPGRDFIGIMPGWAENLFRPGNIGVVSRSGSLGALINLNLVSGGFGQSAFIGIGGDPIVGTTFRDTLEIFEQDLNTKAIVMLGEVGGPMEEEAAEYIPNMTKPVVTFIAGQNAPEGKKMGHAGAMVAGGKGTAQSKMDALQKAGAYVAKVPSEINNLLAKLSL